MKKIATIVFIMLMISGCSPQAAINVIFGPHSEEATRVAECESHMNPNAVSAGGGNHGLFQINNVHRNDWEQSLGRSWAERYDPVLNTAYAYRLSHGGTDWSDWACQP